jgi:uncharacterized protein (TIGR03437 family)
MFSARVSLSFLLVSGAAHPQHFGIQTVVGGVSSNSASTTASIEEAYGKLPIAFEENQGQVDSRVKFLARGNGYTLFLTKHEAVMALRSSNRSSVVRIKLLGSAASTELAGVDPLPGKINYFIERNPLARRTNIQTFAKVAYSSVYPGVGVAFYGNHRQLEFDFMVEPGADPRNIQLEVDGAKTMYIDHEGDLILQVDGAIIRQRQPVVYQETNRGRTLIRSRYVLRGRRRIGFELAAFDRHLPVVIDPVLEYSTYLGGSGRDTVNGIAVDSLGSAYITGSSSSPDFPTTTGPPWPSGSAPLDGLVFITKLNPGGTQIIYSTFIGGTHVDYGSGGKRVAVDSSGNVYVVGMAGPSFPATATISTVSTCLSQGLAGSCVFVAKLGPPGNQILYSAIVPGGSIIGGLAIDAAGNIYVTGSGGSNTITPGVYRGTPGGAHTWLSKVNPSLPGAASLVYATVLGGESGTAIAADPSGNAYIAIWNLGTEPCAGSPGANILKLNSNGTSLVYSSCLTSKPAQIPIPAGIAVDPAGNAYIVGTAGPDFPTTPGAFRTSGGGGFLAKLNPSGSGLVYSTFLGLGPAAPAAVAVDSSGNAFLTGGTTSDAMPVTPDAFQSHRSAPGYAGAAGSDAFLMKVNSFGTALLYSTYLGGTGDEDNAPSAFAGGDIAVDSAGNAYVSGMTSSLDFPVTQNAIQKTLAGPRPQADAYGVLYDGFVSKFNFSASPPILTSSVTSSASNLTGSVAPGEIVTIFGSGIGPSQLTQSHIGSSGLVDTQLAGTQVFFNGTPAPIIYTWATQIAAIVPYSVSGGSAQVTVAYQGQTSSAISVSVASSAPGIFTSDSTGKGQAAAVNQDGSYNTALSPAKVGDIISLYATGEGQTTPAGVDGKVASVSASAPQPNLPVGVTIGGQRAQLIQYAGGVPGQVAGLLQINVQIPGGIQTSSQVPVVVQVGTGSSQSGVTIAVR